MNSAWPLASAGGRACLVAGLLPAGGLLGERLAARTVEGGLGECGLQGRVGLLPGVPRQELLALQTALELLHPLRLVRRTADGAGQLLRHWPADAQVVAFLVLLLQGQHLARLEDWQAGPPSRGHLLDVRLDLVPDFPKPSITPGNIERARQLSAGPPSTAAIRSNVHAIFFTASA